MLNLVFHTLMQKYDEAYSNGSGLNMRICNTQDGTKFHHRSIVHCEKKILLYLCVLNKVYAVIYDRLWRSLNLKVMHTVNEIYLKTKF